MTYAQSGQFTVLKYKSKLIIVSPLKLDYKLPHFAISIVTLLTFNRNTKEPPQNIQLDPSELLTT